MFLLINHCLTFWLITLWIIPQRCAVDVKNNFLKLSSGWEYEEMMFFKWLDGNKVHYNKGKKHLHFFFRTNCVECFVKMEPLNLFCGGWERPDFIDVVIGDLNSAIVRAGDVCEMHHFKAVSNWPLLVRSFELLMHFQVSLAKEISLEVIPSVVSVSIDEFLNFANRYRGKVWCKFSTSRVQLVA